MHGLHLAIGKEKAEKLLKGCKVHWIRSCQRVANKIASSSNKQREKTLFLHLASTIPNLKSSIKAVACFETLQLYEVEFRLILKYHETTKTWQN